MKARSLDPVELVARQLAAAKLRWFRAAVGPLPFAECTRIAVRAADQERRIEAKLWASVPEVFEKRGHGKDRFYPPPDMDKSAALSRARLRACEIHDQVLRAIRARVHTGLRKPFRNFTTMPMPLDPIRRPRPPQPLPLPPLSALLPQTPLTRNIHPVARPPQPMPTPQEPRRPPLTAQGIEEVLETEIPFGKYRGERLADLVADDKPDRIRRLAYLHWLASEAEITSNRFAEAVARAYEVYEQECQDAAEDPERFED